MGKVRTRILGFEEIEKQQKEEQKKKSQDKKIKNETDTDQSLSGAKLSDPKKKNSKRLKQKPGKKYKLALKSIKKDKRYSPEEAVSVLKSIVYGNFDESVEIHLNVEKKGLKGEVSLPHSIGKKTRVAIVSDEIIEQIEKGSFSFDILVSHPSFMPKLAKFARILGPKGLMPSPKNGTVTTDPESVAEKFSGTTIQWKTESKFPLVHQQVGKISQDNKLIQENIEAFMQSVNHSNIRQAFISSTFSPSIEITTS